MASLIYGNKLPQLMLGYRTTINESEIVGVTLEGTANAKFGDVLCHGSERNAVEKKTIANAGDIAGILCATNIKMPRVYPAGSTVDIETEVGEACNLLIRGAVAVKLASDATKANIKPGVKAYVKADGEFTDASAGNFEFGVFSGKVEGSLVEIFVRR